MPLARSSDLVVEELNDEVLVYDLKTNSAHSLSAPVARIWGACDGSSSAVSLSEELGIELDTVSRSLAELAECDLLAGAADGATRREVTVRMVRAGAAVAAAPLIISVMAPTPAMAVTPGACGPPARNCGNACHQRGCCCCTAALASGEFQCVPDVSFCPSGSGCTGPP